jgi:hypothetical protein
MSQAFGENGCHPFASPSLPLGPKLSLRMTLLRLTLGQALSVAKDLALRPWSRILSAAKDDKQEFSQVRSREVFSANVYKKMDGLDR